MALPSAQAADLGGDCCADLEERVAELEATTARKGNRKVSLVVSGQVNRAMMFWDDGAERGIYSVDNSQSRSGFQFDGSARINPNLTAGFTLVVGLSSGARSHHASQLDDDGFPQPAGNIGGVFASPPTTGYSGGDATLGLELANWYLDHKQLGRITVGRINTAVAGTTTVDLGGAGVIANAHIGGWNANFLLFDKNSDNFVGVPGNSFTAGNGAATWNTLMGGNFMSFSGLSRGEGISYTTPTFGGFSASGSIEEGYGSSFQGGAWDVAARYAGEFGGFRLAAAVGYCVNCGFVQDINDGGNGAGFVSGLENADVRKLQGSASVLHVASGLYLTGALSRVEYRGPTAGELVAFTAGDLVGGQNRPDTNLLYLQGGITKNWTGLGNTIVYGEYSRIDDGITGAGATANSARCPATFTCMWGASEVSVWGIGLVQNIDAAAMELYLSYRNYSGETSRFNKSAGGVVTETEFDLPDLSIVMTGARIRF